MNQDIYISLGITEVEDYEHELPDAAFSAIIVNSVEMVEEKVPCGSLEELIPFIQVF